MHHPGQKYLTIKKNSGLDAPLTQSRPRLSHSLRLHTRSTELFLLSPSPTRALQRGTCTLPANGSPRFNSPLIPPPSLTKSVRPAYRVMPSCWRTR